MKHFIGTLIYISDNNKTRYHNISKEYNTWWTYHVICVNKVVRNWYYEPTHYFPNANLQPKKNNIESAIPGICTWHQEIYNISATTKKETWQGNWSIGFTHEIISKIRFGFFVQSQLIWSREAIINMTNCQVIVIACFLFSLWAASRQYSMGGII